MTRTLEQRQILAAADRIKKAERKAAAKGRGERVQPVRDGRQREPRVREPLYLAWVRRLPCVAGAVDPHGSIEGQCKGAVQAAHLRMTAPGKRNPGMGAKPDDAWCTPLCAHHHLDDQHRGSEALFWARLDVDPVDLCRRLHAAYEAGADGNTIVREFAKSASDG